MALLELAIREEDEILRLNIVDEKHYQLVSRTKIFNVELEVLKRKRSEIWVGLKYWKTISCPSPSSKIEMGSIRGSVISYTLLFLLWQLSP
ncbi:MAG: hypothetical protein M5U34_13310 [Chloroflexi bacterium]|nr:hypothetical protein [Chloroflexota bacterium]